MNLWSYPWKTGYARTFSTSDDFIKEHSGFQLRVTACGGKQRRIATLPHKFSEQHRVLPIVKLQHPRG